MDTDTTTTRQSSSDDGWSRAAASYVEIVGPCMIPYANELMRLLDGSIRGKRVLEVGAGPGWYGIEAVRKGGAASVVITDPCPEMIRLGRQHAAEEGLGSDPRIRFAVEDGRNLAEPDASFDAVLCLNTLTVLPDMERDQCLAEMVRVLKPGGLVVLSAYSSPENQKWFDPFLEALGSLAEEGTDVPCASAIYSHAWNTQESFQCALEEEKRGLTNVSVVSVALPWLIPPTDIGTFCEGFSRISPHISPLLGLVAPDLQDKIPQAIRATLKASQSDSGEGPAMLNMMHMFAFARRR